VTRTGSSTRCTPPPAGRYGDKGAGPGICAGPHARLASPTRSTERREGPPGPSRLNRLSPGSVTPAKSPRASPWPQAGLAWSAPLIDSLPHGRH
jgi:hypothetical protein